MSGMTSVNDSRLGSEFMSGLSVSDSEDLVAAALLSALRLMVRVVAAMTRGVFETRRVMVAHSRSTLSRYSVVMPVVCYGLCVLCGAVWSVSGFCGAVMVQLCG